MHTGGVRGVKKGARFKRSGGRSKGSKRVAKARALTHSGWRPEVEVLFMLGVVVSALLLVSPAMAQDSEAKVRMAHLSPDAPSVRVELDGEPVEALADVSYRDATPYLPIPAGPHDVAVYAAADSSEPVLEVSIAPEAGESYTIAGVGLLEDDTFGARLFQDDLEPEDDKAKVRVIHAIPDVGPATVSVEDGPDLFAIPGFANASNYAEVDAGTYTLEVTPAGAEEPAFDAPDVEVENGEIYTAFAIGQASEGTLDTLLTVDSDDGRIVGPKTLEDTSGDLSLLQKPQAGSASNFVPTIETPADEPKDAPKKEKSAEESSDKGSSDKGSSGKKDTDDQTSNEAATEEGENDGSSPEPTPPIEAPVAEPVTTSVAEPMAEYVAEAPIPNEPYKPYVEPVAVVEDATTPVAPLAYQAPEFQAAPSEPVVVPSVDEVAPVTLSERVSETLVETGLAETRIPDPPVEPVASQPVAPTPNVPVPSVSVPSVSVSVEVPPVPVAQVVSVDSTPISKQDVAQTVTQSGFVPPAPSAITQTATAQTVTQTSGLPVPGNPAESVVGVFVNTPAIVNSGARRRFVTIRKDWFG